MDMNVKVHQPCFNTYAIEPIRTRITQPKNPRNYAHHDERYLLHLCSIDIESYQTCISDAIITNIIPL